MNPDEVVQLALTGIAALIQLVAKVQAAHQMSDAQLDAYINATDAKTRQLVGDFLTKMRAASPVAPPAESAPNATPVPAAILAAAAPDAATGAE